MLSKAGNFVAFQLGCCASVLGAAHDDSWLGPLVVALLLGIHLWQTPHPGNALRLILRVGLLGATIDSVLGYLGILVFRDSLMAHWLCPPWLMALWMIFVTTLQSSLSWLAGHYWIAALLGGLFEPVSYYAGQELGSLSLGNPVLVTLATLSILWALLLPGLVWWAAKQTEG
ncbi:MAG: DUF2878 domain-containing protein [Nitrospirota bacterium]|nr:DUF2878 domain-containing protein [Nitrospirota bacterium]